MDWQRIFHQIPGVETFTSVALIQKGFSTEQKYFVTTQNNENKLLRVADITHFDKMERTYRTLVRVHEAGVPTHIPIALGTYQDGVCEYAYQLLSWCPGSDGSDAYYKADDRALHQLGTTAGNILRKIHQIKPDTAPHNANHWYDYYTTRFSNYIKQIDALEITIPGHAQIEQYFNENKHLLRHRDIALYHGDYHCHNFARDENGQIHILDWETAEYGDPWYDFHGLNNHDIKPAYATALINAYFNGNVPDDFWRVFALYLTYGSLALVSWAAKTRGDHLTYDPLALCLGNIANHMQAFNQLTTPKPSWYSA
ncbi:MAG: phosphotransferase [Defluviitaleaceae bacterium]|nr:phosphotransferase [Defluviitaleaceae bacterium]